MNLLLRAVQRAHLGNQKQRGLFLIEFQNHLCSACKSFYSASGRERNIYCKGWLCWYFPHFLNQLTAILNIHEKKVYSEHFIARQEYIQEYTQVPFALLLRLSIFITRQVFIKGAKLGQKLTYGKQNKITIEKNSCIFPIGWLVLPQQQLGKHVDHNSWQPKLFVIPESVWRKGLSENKNDPLSQSLSSHMTSQLVTGSTSHTLMTSLWNSQVETVLIFRNNVCTKCVVC